MAFNLKPQAAEDDPVFVLERRFPNILRASQNAFTKTHREGLALIDEIATNRFVRDWADHCRPRYPLIFNGTDSAVNAITTALQTISERQKEGCWYPPLQNGVRMKVPVAHFLIAPVTKGNGVFSPFLHFYFQKSEAARIAEAQAELKPRICEMVQSIGLKANMKAPAYFWQGALNLLRYWQDIPEAYLDTDNKKLLLGKASSLFTAVSAYQNAGGWVPDGFVCPESPVWGRFKYWIENNNKVRLP